MNLPITGYGDEGYIHLPSGPIPVHVVWRDDGTPEITIDVKGAPEARLRELDELLTQCAKEGPDAIY